MVIVTYPDGTYGTWYICYDDLHYRVRLVDISKYTILFDEMYDISELDFVLTSYMQTGYITSYNITIKPEFQY